MKTACIIILEAKMIMIDDIEFNENVFFKLIIDKILKLIGSKKIVLGNFNTFIEYLKNDYGFSEYFYRSNSVKKKDIFTGFVELL